MSPHFKDLNILPFHQLLTYNKLLFMHSVIYKYSPPSFHSTWSTSRELGPTDDLRNTDELTILHPRNELYKKKITTIFFGNIMEPTRSNENSTKQNLA